MEKSVQTKQSDLEFTRRDNRSLPENARAEAQSFARCLYQGKIQAEHLRTLVRDEYDEDTLGMTLEAIDRFAKDIDVERIEREHRIPEEYLAAMKQLGLFGLIIPEEYGGFGFSNRAYVELLGKIGTIDPSLSVTVGAHQSIGLKALLLFGTSEQKNTYLPRLASGEWLAAFALTEPEAGSDAQGLKSRAELSEDRTHYVLNGSKIWITNGGLAHFFTVFAKTGHKNLDGTTTDKITAFIVTRDMAGFSSGPEEKKLGLWGSSTTSLHFENVKVPVANVLGEVGKGFKVAMGILNNGRLGLAGACAAGGKKLMENAREHALQRKQFKHRLADFGLIQSKFANMLVENFAAESMVLVTANLMDRNFPDYSIETAMCKVFSTEAQWRTVNDCLQIAGGTGFMREYGYEKALRDSRIFAIWEGANEILRLFIGLSGLQTPGEHLKELALALKNPLSEFPRAIGVLSDFGVKWVQRRVSVPEHLGGIHPIFKKECAHFDRYTALLAEESERLLRRYGKKIIDQEFDIRRLADIGIDLFAVASVLTRVTHTIESRGTESAEAEIRIARAFVRKARRRIRENFRRFSTNDDALESAIAKSFYENGFWSAGP